jgi:hypothetical protein
MSAGFSELIFAEYPEPVTLAEIKAALNVTDDEQDGFLALLAFSARSAIEGQTGFMIAQQRWHVPARALPHMTPHRVIVERDGGYEIETGFAPAELPAVLRAALLKWIAWAFENRDAPSAEAPSFRHLRGTDLVAAKQLEAA